MTSHGVEPEYIAVAGAGVVMSFPVNDSSPSYSPTKLPRRLRHRLSDCRTNSTTTAEDIEAKLNGAHLRRQQFYESLSSKARPRQRSPPHLNDLGQRLETKLNAAEQKRLSVLTNKQHRAARSVQLLNAVNSAHAIAQREMERLKKTDLLEGRLQKARRLRAELLRQRKNSSCSPCASACIMSEEAENLARKLARSWRQFVKTKGTTYSLTKAFKRLNMSTKAVKSTPFEQLALLMGSNSTLKTVKSLLDRLELHLKVQKGTNNPSEVKNIDHLLKHITPPNQSRNISFTNKTKGQKRTTRNKSSSRYPVRIALCAYMIMAHPRGVLSRSGTHETTGLEEAAVKLVHEFELVVRVILEGGCLKSKGGGCNVGFRSQLGVFDKAWCSYLYCFTVWKVKDAKVLEDDLVRGACQLELSMMRTCKVTLEGNENDLTFDKQAIRKQVYEDQALLKAKVKHLSGESGINRLESALSDVRTKFFASKKTGNQGCTQAGTRPRFGTSTGTGSGKS